VGLPGQGARSQGSQLTCEPDVVSPAFTGLAKKHDVGYAKESRLGDLAGLSLCAGRLHVRRLVLRTEVRRVVPTPKEEGPSGQISSLQAVRRPPEEACVPLQEVLGSRSLRKVSSTRAEEKAGSLPTIAVGRLPLVSGHHAPPGQSSGRGPGATPEAADRPSTATLRSP
jgi:hypothetical protein